MLFDPMGFPVPFPCVSLLLLILLIPKTGASPLIYFRS